MSEETKIVLSAAELIIVQDTAWILTKQRIIKNVYELFHARVDYIKSSFAKQGIFLSPQINLAVPKIYKGENYLQFPYVIMDFPAVFSKEHVFALRTMFWWGNFFSVTLHIAGTYKELYAGSIIKKLNLAAQDFYICINETEWQHNFEPDNYLAAKQITTIKITEIIERPFIKVALKYDLQQWNNMHQLLEDAYDKIFMLLKN
ncbi:MAG: hypothetical protein ABJA37_01635 [Ferruginibacter sp.]